MHALGRLFDIGVGCVPTDAVAAAVTGERVHLKNAGGVTIVVITTGASTDVLDVDLQQHTVGTAGTPADLDIITSYFYKSATTLDNSQTWTRGTQSVASEITNVGAASEQLLLVIEVEATQLSDGYEWVSLNLPDQGSNATKFCAVLYLLRDLEVARRPAALVSAVS